VAESKTSAVKPAGLKPIPYVVIRRADGSLVLRHPDEIKPVSGQSSVVSKGK
jgi:hypothetical protein